MHNNEVCIAQNSAIRSIFSCHEKGKLSIVVELLRANRKNCGFCGKSTKIGVYDAWRASSSSSSSSNSSSSSIYFSSSCI